MAEERDRTSPDLRSPSPPDDLAEAHRRNRRAFGRYFGDCARSGAEQAQAEDGASMRVDAAGTASMAVSARSPMVLRRPISAPS